MGESLQLLLAVALQATFYLSKSSYLPLSASFSILSITYHPSADILYFFSLYRRLIFFVFVLTG